MLNDHARTTRAVICRFLLCLLLPVSAAMAPVLDTKDGVDREWRDRFIMGYFAELMRSNELAQRHAWAELTATRQSGDLRSQLRAVARYLLVTDSALLDCKLAKDSIEAARSAGAAYLRELFDVGVAAASNMFPHRCPGLMDASELQALALQLGDPARQFFVLEAKVLGLTSANRFNDVIEVRTTQMNYAIAAFQRSYCMVDLVQATLRASPGSPKLNGLLEDAHRELAGTEFAALRTNLDVMMFRSKMAEGDLKGVLQIMDAALPAVRSGILGPHGSAFTLISFARALDRAHRSSEALALLEDSKHFNAPAKPISAARSRATLEVLTNLGTAKAFAHGLREVQHLSWLLADKAEFGPQHTRIHKIVIAKFFERFGKHDVALAALAEANQAGEELERLASKTARVELQERLKVAARDRENSQLRAQAELQAERQRGWIAALGIALLGGVGTAAALGMAVRRGRQLARLSAELELRNTELEQRSASRIRLLAAACHDLRQPAHALGMLAELGHDAKREPARFSAWLQSVRRSADSLSDRLDELMDLGRLDGGRYTPQLSDVPLAELLRDVMQHFSGPAQRKGLSLQVATTEIHVVSDRHLLRRIIFNLVANAVKYTDVGVVRVDVHLEGDALELTVQDSGPGIPPDKLDDIFRDYVRLNPNKAEEGLGIGLSIVRRAAELLGHELALVSPPGKGTTASLHLPRSPAPPTGPGPARAAPAACVGGVIALLEDDADVCEAMAALLRRWGYVVPLGSDAQTVLAEITAQQHHPGLIITDLHLHNSDGLQEVNHLREALRDPELPALLVTGDMDTAISPLAADAGVHVTHKPLAPAKLSELVKTHIRPPSARTGQPPEPAT